MDARGNGHDSGDSGDARLNLFEQNIDSRAECNGGVVFNQANLFHERPGGQPHLERKNIVRIAARGSVEEPEKCVTINPAPTCSTTARAICSTTNVLRNVWCRVPAVVPLVLAFIASITSGRDDRHAGTTPKSSPVDNASRMVKPSAPVSSAISPARGNDTGLIAMKSFNPRYASATPSEASDHGKQNTFTQKLPGNTPAAGAQGGAYSHFLLSRQGPRQQQTGHVRTGDQQHQRDHALNDQERLTNPANVDIQCGLQPYSPALVGGRVNLG